MIVRVAAPADLTRLCRTARLAFADDPVMRWMYPADEDYTDAAFDWSMRRWVAFGAALCTDDVVGLACWIPPDRTEPQFEAPRLDHPQDRLDRFAAIGKLIDEHTPAEPHWYLNLLGTHPDWQRQGIGRTLMEPMWERAAAEGVPCYLETETIENVAYYRHCGYEVRSEWDVPLDGPHMWGMLRP